MKKSPTRHFSIELADTSEQLRLVLRDASMSDDGTSPFKLVLHPGSTRQQKCLVG